MHLVVKHLVEELSQRWMHGKRAHTRAADVMGVDDPVGAGLKELRLIGLVVGAGHDEQLGVQSPRRQGDVDVGGVGVECCDQRRRPLDSGVDEHLVVRCITMDDDVVMPVGTRSIDHHDLGIVMEGVLGNGSAHAATASDDDVSGHLVDHALFLPKPNGVIERTFDQRFHQNTQGVQGRTHTEEHQEQRKPAIRRVDLFGGADLFVAHGGDGDRGLVQGVKGTQTQDPVAGEADETIGGRDCYRAALPDALLLAPEFDGVERVTARLSATRRDRVTALLPMLRRPHADGGPGAVRVEVRGIRPSGERDTEVLSAVDHPSVAAAVVAAVATQALLDGSWGILGSRGLAAVQDPGPWLRELARRGVKAARFSDSA